MTGLIPEKEFSRKTLLKGGGALIVGFSALGATAGKASAANAAVPFSKRTPADFLPDQTQIDSWITVNADNTITVTHGETELGHGTPTGILMIVAEEMNADFSQMKFAHVESWLQAVGGGNGSSGISARSTTIRAAAALAKTTLLGLASAQLGVPVANLSVASGVVSGGGRTVTYGALLGGKLFSTQMTAANTGSPASPPANSPGIGNTKPVSQYGVVGKAFPRIDIPAKVAGTYTYIQNVRIPGMLHARIVRPRGSGANTVENANVLSVDPTSIAHIPGAQIVQINNFLAVVAPLEYDAIQAAAQLKVTWQTQQGFPQPSGNYWSWLRTAGDTNTVTPARYTANSGPSVDTALAGAAKTVTATYRYHYNGFMEIGPHCACADMNPDGSGGTVYEASQSINGLPAQIQAVLAGLPNSKWVNTPPANIRIVWYEGASSFGGGLAGTGGNEPGEIAAVISATIGKPVRMQLMRWDMHGWDHYGMANMFDVTMGADATGRIVAANWQTYGQVQSNIDETRRELGQVTWPTTPGAGGIAPSDSSVYAVTSYGAAYQYPRRVLAKSQPLYGGALKCNFLRAPSAPQSFFASEQIVDELAHASNMDPVAFRRLNIDGTTTAGARWLAVMDAATIAAGWKAKVSASNLQSGDIVSGRGFGFGTYASSQVAIVADVKVNRKTGKIMPQHLFIAQNNGITMGPQLVGNQMSGAAIMGLSRAMMEQVTWNKERVTSLDWVTYPILRFKDHPSVTLVNVHPGQYVTIVPGALDTDVTAGNTQAFNEGWTVTGSGEPPTAAIGSSIANAVFDATGVRVRQSPLTLANVRGAFKAAGIS
jgi:CO/xanthine dehydrogenase Mo-binding subunit